MDPASTLDRRRSARELPGVDALRIGACLVIAAFHARAGGLADAYWPLLRTIAGPPALAPHVTSLVLALSGFVLAYAESGRRSTRPRPAADFWRARAARLVPLMILGHLLAAPFVLVGASRLPVGEALVRGAFVVTALQAWIPKWALSYDGPSWSLSVLAFGYLLFPWIDRTAARLGARRLLFLLGMSWAVSIAAAMSVLGAADAPIAGALGTAGEIVHYLPLLRVLEFVAGVLLGHLWLRRRAGVAADGPNPWPIAAALGVVACAIAIGIARSTWPDPAAVTGYGALMPLTWAVIWGATSPQVTSATALHWARVVGRASFPVYVLHDPLLSMVNVVLFRGWAGTHGTLLLALWFLALVPVGVAVDRWFVTPLAKRLLARDAPPAIEAGAVVRAGHRTTPSLPPARASHPLTSDRPDRP